MKRNKKIDKKKTINKFYKLPIEDKKIFYSAYNNYIMAGNPYAIFKNIIEDERFKDYEHIWAYKDEESLKNRTFQKYRDSKNVKYVNINSKDYLKALATSKYLFNNSALPTYFKKRKEQIYTQTWHGTPLKSIGPKFDNQYKLSSVQNAQRNFIMCDNLLMPNKFTADTIMESYYLPKSCESKILDIGYPRIDLVQNTNKDEIRKLLETKIKKSLTNKKVVLYAPTFRSEKGIPIDDHSKLIEELEEVISKETKDCEVFFKIHVNSAKALKKNKNISSRLIFDEIETNELLSCVDILITDYSSIFFDFLVTKKPIIFFCYDFEEYASLRGILFKKEEFPGAVVKEISELRDSIIDITNNNYNYSKNQDNFLNKFSYADKGNSSKLAIEQIFFREQKQSSKATKSLLFDLSLENTIENTINAIETIKSNYTDYDEFLLFQKDFTTRVNPRVELLYPKVKILSNQNIKELFNIGTTITLKYSNNVHIEKQQKSLDISSLKTDENKLVILIIGFSDSTNISFPNLIKEAISRNHKIIIAVPKVNDEHNNEIFTQNNLTFVSLDSVPNFINLVDIVVSSPIKTKRFSSVYKTITTSNVVSFSFISLFSSVASGFNADFRLCLGKQKEIELKENFVNFSTLLSGDPALDRIPKIEKVEKVDKCLIIDQGAYPFGEKGKQQFANTIINICENNKNVSFTLRTRYSNNAKVKQVHKVSEYLLDFFEYIPNNLEIKDSKNPMYNEVLLYDMMITTWSTAFIYSAKYNIPLLFIEGFDSVDVFDVRKNRIDDAYKLLSSSKCVYNYKDLLNKKLIVKQIDSSFRNNLLYKDNDKSSKFVLDFFELCKKELIIKNRKIVNKVNSCIDNSKIFSNSKYISRNDENFKKYIVLKDIYNNRLNKYVYTNRCLENNLNLECLESIYEKYNNTEGDLISIKKFKSEIGQQFIDIQKEFFESKEGKEKINSSIIYLDYYLLFLFKQKEFTKCLECAKENKQLSLYHIYSSKIYKKKGKNIKAIKEFVKFYDLIPKNQVLQISKYSKISDTSIYLTKTTKEKFITIFYLLSKKRYEIIEEIIEDWKENSLLKNITQILILENKLKKEDAKRIIKAILKKQ